jgi:hypothetical protein
MELYQQLFLSKDNLSVHSLKLPYPFFDKLKTTPSSILLEYQTEIKNMVEKHIAITNRASFLSILQNHSNLKYQRLSTAFQQLLIQNPTNANIQTFCNLFSLYLFQIQQFSENANIYSQLIQSLPKQNISLLPSPIPFQNPIQIYNYQNEHHDILYQPLLKIIQRIHEPELQHLTLLNISNLNFANYIDLHLPSIGPLYPIFEDMPNRPSLPDFFSHASIYDMYFKIMNGDNRFHESIPLRSLQIHKTIAELILQKSKSQSNELIQEFSSFSDENQRLMNMVENSIQGIQFTLNDVMKDEKKETAKVRNEYILPYSITQGKLEKMKDTSIVSKTDAKDVLKYNRDIIHQLLSNPKFEKDFTNNPEQIEHTKNCLAIYVYISITLFYDCYKYYLDQMTKILNELIEDDRFRKFELKPTFQYMDNLNQSLFLFKKILENCFYHSFLPSKLNSKYGISIHKEKGFFQMESRLLSNLTTIYQMYPFQIIQEPILHVNNYKKKPNEVKPNLWNTTHLQAKSAFINFALQHRHKNDVYDTKLELYVGGFIHPYKKNKDILGKFNEYLKILYYVVKWNEIIGSVLKKSFEKNIPIEIFGPILSFIETNQFQLKLSKYQNTVKEDVKKVIVKDYEEDIKRSASSLIQLAEIKQRVYLQRNQKKENKQKLEDFNLQSKLFYHKTKILTDIIKQYIQDETFQNALLLEMKEMHKRYETIVVEKTRNLQQNIETAKKPNISIPSSNEMQSTNVNKNKNQNQNKNKNKNEKNNSKTLEFVQELKNLIPKEDILFPYEENGKLMFISFFTPSNQSISNQDFQLSNVFIISGDSTKTIFEEKKVRILKSSFVETIQKMNMIGKQSILKDIITNIDNYYEVTEDTNGEFASLLKNRCEMQNIETCKLIFVSEQQMIKISQMATKS